MKPTLAVLSVVLLLGVNPPLRAAPQPVAAHVKPDRVVINVAGKLFTEYLFTADGKYPYFFPVIGPRTGRSVTTRGETNFPHHSSIFFGCDRVSGGNYWQEGLQRGRIVSRQVRLVREAGDEAVFEQDCDWERPGAPSPFSDRRVIRIAAPSADLRVIDFEVTLTAKNKVRIDQSNHSLFAVRVRPELSVKGGGRLVNSLGDAGEKGTFGKKAPWADYRGTHGGETEGVALFVHPRNRWSPAPWFTRDYGFMSPTPVQWLDRGFVEFEPGESLRLRYRVVVHANNPSAPHLEALYQEWTEK